jgi:hypothetical protein
MKQTRNFAEFWSSLLAQTQVIQHFKKACKNYVFKTWVIALMGFYSHHLKYPHFKFHKNRKS